MFCKKKLKTKTLITAGATFLLLGVLYSNTNNDGLLNNSAQKRKNNKDINTPDVTIDSFRLKLKERIQIFEDIEKYHNNNLQNAKPSLPKAIIIGARKCGTGSLTHFLHHHPLVFLPKTRIETRFFNENPTKNMEMYRNLFPPTNEREMSIEKTPHYFDCYSSYVSRQIKEAIPNVKLLLVLCNPTERAFSDFIHMNLDFSMEKFSDFDSFLAVHWTRINKLIANYKNQSFEEINESFVDSCKHDYATTILTAGLYYYKLQPWLKLFNNSNLMIIDGDKWLENPGLLIEDVQDFLGLPKLLWKEDFIKNPDNGFYCYKNQNEILSYSEESNDRTSRLKCMRKGKGRSRNGARKMTNQTISKLKNLYAPYNQKLFRLLNRSFDWRT